MKTIGLTKYMIIVAGALLFSSPAAATESEAPEQKMVAIDSTMNALDYVLQRPNPNETFESKKFGDHLFFSVGGGGDWTRSDNGPFGIHPKTGYRLGLSVGDWITPVHGWRLSVEGGVHKGVNDSRPKFVSVSADYLMNFTSLLRKYNPDRKFELIGVAGLEVEGLFKGLHDEKMAYGVHIGLQPRVYLSPMTYLYLEPRFGFYSDGIDMATTWNRYDWNASIMVGIGFRMNPLRGFRVDNSQFEDESFADNLFYGANAGINTLLKASSGHQSYSYGATVGAFVGKWFTATSGLRLSGHAGVINQPRSPFRWVGLGDLDYLLNLNSLLAGYDPERKFDSNLVLGFSGALASGSSRKFAPGFHGGLQFLWNLTPSFALYAEPSVRVMSNRLSAITSSHALLMPAVNLGFIYRMRHPRFRNGDNESIYEGMPFSRRFFIDLAGGVFIRHRDWQPNHAFGVSLGEWFTSSSAWRLSGEYNWMKYRYNYLSLTASADYLLSLGALTDGYDPDRIFDVAPFVGMGIGMAHYDKSTNNFMWGPRAGLRASFRLSSLFDIILEPSVRINALRHASRRYTPEAHFMAGISYKFPPYKHRDKSDDSKLFNAELPSNFLSIQGGPSMFSEHMLNSSSRPVSWNVGVSAGHWFSNVSGLEFAVQYDFINRNNRISKLDVGTARIDYLFNLTKAATGLTAPRFSIIGIVGAGIGWSNDSDGHVSPAAYLGVRGDLKLIDNLHLTLTPGLSFWRTALNRSMPNHHHFIGTGALPIGLTYDF